MEGLIFGILRYVCSINALKPVYYQHFCCLKTMTVISSHTHFVTSKQLHDVLYIHQSTVSCCFKSL